jgi:hypothetical protein
MNDPTRPPKLDSLLELDESTADWTDADMAAMLRHQLSASLDGAAAVTLGALLHDPLAPADRLQALKRLAKVRRAQPPPGMPADLWRVIYFAAIAAAIRAGHGISELSPDELASGFRWALSRSWLEPSLRPIFEQAANSLPRQ